MFAVILAGGGGTRLWPLSRPDRPKPFLPLLGGRSLLQMTWDRLVPDLLRPGDVAVVANAAHADLVRAQLPELDPRMLLEEPVSRNTAAAIAYAALALGRADDDVMLVLPADHVVDDEEGFRHLLRRAVDTATAAGRAGPPLVTLGIAPGGPETGYGYIVAGAASVGTQGGRIVGRFVEKPSRAAASRLLAQEPAVAWNAGIFAWRVDAIRSALDDYAPGVLAVLAPAVASGSVDIADAYSRIPDTSIDYAVLEPAAADGRVAMILADVGWSDLGSWTALRDELARRSAGNAGDRTSSSGPAGWGPRRDTGSRDSLVIAGQTPIVTVGLHGVIVVDAGDVIPVAAADAAQDVKSAAAAWALDPLAPDPVVA